MGTIIQHQNMQKWDRHFEQEAKARDAKAKSTAEYNNWKKNNDDLQDHYNHEKVENFLKHYGGGEYVTEIVDLNGLGVPEVGGSE